MKVRIRVTIVKEFDVESEGDCGGPGRPARSPEQVIEDEIYALQVPGNADLGVLIGRTSGHVSVRVIQDAHGWPIKTVLIEKLL